MTEKSVEQQALDTLNALIAGRYVPASTFVFSATTATLDKAMLRSLEDQLLDYYREREKERSKGRGYSLDNVS